MSTDNIVRHFLKKKIMRMVRYPLDTNLSPLNPNSVKPFSTVTDQQKLSVFVFVIISIIPELFCKNYCGNGTRTVSFCLSGTENRTVIKWNHKRWHDKFLVNNAASINIKVKIFYFILTAFYGLDRYGAGARTVTVINSYGSATMCANLFRLTIAKLGSHLLRGRRSRTLHRSWIVSSSSAGNCTTTTLRGIFLIL